MSPFRMMTALELAEITKDCASCKDAMFEWAFVFGGPIEWNEWQKGFALVRKAFPSTAPSAKLPGYTATVREMYHEAMELHWGEDWDTQLKEQRGVPLEAIVLPGSDEWLLVLLQNRQSLEAQ